MSDPKNEETPEKTSTTPSVDAADDVATNEVVAQDPSPVDPEGGSAGREPAAAPAGADESLDVPPVESGDGHSTESGDEDRDESGDERSDGTAENRGEEEAETRSIDGSAAETVALPVVAPGPAEAPTVQIPVRSHVPKAPPQRIPPRTERPPAEPEPARVTIQPTPTRIPPARDTGRGRRLAVAGGAVLVVAVVAAVAFVFLQQRADDSPESRIRASIDTFVGALEAGDLDALRASTCGGLADFYASVDPEDFREIHRLAVEQGEIPVVTSVDRVQITENNAIAQVTAHTTNSPSDVTDRTFDLELVGEEWKVCGE
ncbi:hypothetical protein [Rhodococcus sp. NPDC047139]|uniref:Rv0361 family membrane protein n=1 Tax=Rhodococcus sp. NPDC047139 TaxID=3155141 RepID=UPI003406BF5F